MTEHQPEEESVESDSNLTQHERAVLNYIDRGLDSNVLLMLCLNEPDGRDLQRLILDLIADGYVARKGSVFMGSITYRLTRKGEEKLPELTEREHRMRSEFGLSADAVDILVLVDKLDRSRTSADVVADELGLDPEYLQAVIERLTDEQYLRHRGILLPKLQLTGKGHNIVTRARATERSPELINE